MVAGQGYANFREFAFRALGCIERVLVCLLVLLGRLGA
jgi:hypothetical protein